jgi:putative DNA methylase
MNDLRLIEDYLPIEAISAEASREKSVRKGHISTLHLWWARRPLVACRAAVYGALVPADRWVKEVKLKQPPEDEERATKAKNGKKKGLNRKAAKEFVERLCKYPGEPRVIAEAQKHILEAHAERLSEELAEAKRTGNAPAWVEEFKFTGEKVTYDDIVAGRAPRPRVLDMFAGGGAIPLEALRLGCEAYALDLNPVAHIIELCTLVYPQKYGKPDPNVRGMTGPKNSEGETTWGGLAEEVRFWGNWVLEKVKAEIGDLYPPIPDPEAKPEEIGAEAQASFEFAGDGQQRLKTSGRFLTPVAYLWTRTVRCKNPNCGATVPLVRQTWLCKKKDRCVAMRMNAPRRQKQARFEIVEAASERTLGFDPASFSKGGNATCPFCETVADNPYIKAEGSAKRMGKQLMAVVATGAAAKGKAYIPAEAAQYIDEAEVLRRALQAFEAAGASDLIEPMPARGTLGFRVQAYGLTTWGDVFTERQRLSLATFLCAIRLAERELAKMELPVERCRAVVTMLACVLDKQADFNSSLCVLKADGGRGIVHTFGRHALPMIWDFAEANPLNDEIACWRGSLAEVVGNIADLQLDNACLVTRGSAFALPWYESHFDAVITDPPYYDNVPYASISDFFYVWLRRSVGHLYPEHFATDLTPKRGEAIAEPALHRGSKSAANAAYEDMMRRSFTEANRVLKVNGTVAVVYAHKTTLGWASLVDALRGARFEVTEAWPLDTETSGRLRAHSAAALASSIFLIARKQSSANTVGNYEDDVQPDLRAIVRERVDTLWDMGIAGADLVIACVGAGLRAFTKYDRVEYANGEEVPAEKFLAEVEGVVLDAMMGKLFGQSGSTISAIDPASRFYVLWRFIYKAAEIDAGEAIVFTYGLHVELDGASGLSGGKDALVEKKKAKYCARDFTERGDNAKLGLPGDDGRPPPLIDVLHRLVWLMENSPRKIGEFLAESQPDRERLRVLAQALAGAALKGKSEADAARLVSTTPAEQSALGKLLANWRSVVEHAAVPKEERADRKAGQRRLELE